MSRACLILVSMPPQAPTLTMEGGRLKRSLQRAPGRDFEMVPEPVWRAFYHWYGANLSLPRPVSEDCRRTTAASQPQCRCEAGLGGQSRTG